MNWLGRAEEGTSSEWLKRLAATESRRHAGADCLDLVAS